MVWALHIQFLGLERISNTHITHSLIHVCCKHRMPTQTHVLSSPILFWLLLILAYFYTNVRLRYQTWCNWCDCTQAQQKKPKEIGYRKRWDVLPFHDDWEQFKNERHFARTSTCTHMHTHIRTHTHTRTYTHMFSFTFILKRREVCFQTAAYNISNQFWTKSNNLEWYVCQP